MRVNSFDSFRVIAILAVISIHTQPFSKTSFFGEFDFILNAMIYQGTRFAVPFFFLVSGYFLGKKLDLNKSDSKKIIYDSVIRLLDVWLFWNIFYILITETQYDVKNAGIFNLIYGRFYNYLSYSSWEHIFFEGARTSLWYLISLVIAFMIIGIFNNAKTKFILYGLSIFLYIFGLLAGTYPNTQFGFSIDFNTRNGPFISTIFVVTGYLVALTHLEHIKTRKVLFILAAGILISILENFYLFFNHGKFALFHEYLLGTYFVGLGIFLVLLSRPQTMAWNWLSSLGKYTLGIYVLHSLFNWNLWPFRYYFDNPIWEIIYPIMIYLITLVVTYLLSKIKYTRKYVV